MNEKMNSSRGCFDRHDDEPETNEYASPPCYMHEVDPSYFGLLSSTRQMPDRDASAPKIIARTSQDVRVQKDAIVVWTNLQARVRALSHTIGREASKQIERMEARRKVRAVARLRARIESKR